MTTAKIPISNPTNKIDAHSHAFAHEKNSPMKARENVAKAYAVGLGTYYLMDHFTFPIGFDDPTPFKTDSISQEKYVKLQKVQQQLKFEYQGGLDVFLGAEVDYLPKFVNETKTLLAKFPFDYVTGSVHYIGKYTNSKGEKMTLNIDSTHSWDNILKAFDTAKFFVITYYEYLQKMVKSNLFDNCSHLDLPKKFNENNKYFNSQENWYQAIVQQTLNVIAQSGMSIEINISGKYKPCKEFYPSPEILSKAFRLGIPIIIGSDAHKPEDIGRDNDEAIAYAKTAGYTKICRYVQRTKEFLDI